MKTGKWPPWWQFEWLFQRRYRATYATVITSWCLWNVSTSIWNHDFVSSTSSRRHRRHSWRTVRLKSASNANHCGTVFVEYRFCAKFISTCYDVKLYLFLVGPLRKKKKMDPSGRFSPILILSFWSLSTYFIGTYSGDILRKVSMKKYRNLSAKKDQEGGDRIWIGLDNKIELEALYIVIRLWMMMTISISLSFVVGSVLSDFGHCCGPSNCPMSRTIPPLFWLLTLQQWSAPTQKVLIDE